MNLRYRNRYPNARRIFTRKRRHRRVIAAMLVLCIGIAVPVFVLFGE